MPDTQLRGRVVVISGASSGIGQATAEAFARRGARLVLSARGMAALEGVAQNCRDLGAEVVAVEADVTDPASAPRIVERALTRYGKIDLWMSNVGVGAVGRFEETPLEAHDKVIRSNLVGHINDAHAVVPVFLRQGHGTFINMISLGGFAALPYASAYAASKFGLRGFSEALRAELADHPQIHVCDVYPAFIDTPGILHAANYTGRKLSAPPPLYDPRTVADAVVSIALRPRPTTTVGWVTNVVRAAHAVAPALCAGIMARVMKTYFMRAPPALKTDGNLHSPPAIAGGIDGGFRSQRQRDYAAAAGAVGAVAATALLIGLLRPGIRSRAR